MRILQQDYAHPPQASGLRLGLFKDAPPAEERVSGMLPGQDGFLLTEERIGSGAVVKTLGFFTAEADARATLAVREEALAGQGWRKAAEPLPPPSFPPGGLDMSEPESAAAALAYGAEPERVSVPDDPTPRPINPA
jgi:hypothetical protein